MNKTTNDPIAGNADPQPPLLANPVGKLINLAHSHPRRLIIGLAGLPGAGKSTLAAQWTAEVNAATEPGTMLALGMDGFHLTQAQLRQMPNPAAAFARRGAPWTFDPVALAERLLQVRRAAGQTAVSWPDFQHDIGDPIEGAITIPPTIRLVLVEGLYLLHQEGDWAAVSQCFDERWYLDTHFDTAMQRLIERHIHAWRWTREAATERVASNDRLNANAVQATRAFADFILNN